MDALLRRRSMIADGGGSPTPPGPVVSVPYIRGGSDGSYIDTGIAPDNTTKVIVWARNFNQVGAGNVWLFGSRVAYKDTMFDLVLGNDNATGAIAPFYGDASVTWVYDAWRFCSHYHKYEMGSNGLYIDDVQIATVEASSFSSNLNLHLFGVNSNGTHSGGSALPIDICACKIYKGGVLVRDFTPVSSPSVGLYDAVSDTVFTNAGTGSFTYGTFNSNAYTPLEYITTSGASAFVTPAIGTYSLPIVTKFRPTSTSAAYFSPIGGRDDTNRCEIFTGNSTKSNCRLNANLGDGISSVALYSSNTAGAVRNKELVVVKNNNTFTAYYNNAAFGSTVTFSVGASYSTGIQIGIGATWQEFTAGNSFGSYFVGNINYVGLGAYNLVPAKVNGVAGMYDTYNDIFYPSTTSTPFTAGPEL